MLLQQMSLFLVVAYLFTKSPFFKSFKWDTLHTKQKFYLYFVFSIFSILGTYFGLPVQDAISNTRAIGAVLAGLIGGPLLGTAVGFTAGLHRYTLGGFTAFSCGVSTTVEGLLGGLVHLYLMKKSRPNHIFSPWIALAATFVAEIVQMLIILLLARPYGEAVSLVRVIALPMILANSAGAALFVSIIRDQKTTYDRFSVIFSAKALKVAEKTLAILVKGFNKETALEVAKLIHKETGVGAVAITDRETVLAFVGEGHDHHKAGQPISSSLTKRAIKENRIIYADGIHEHWTCSLSESCPLGSALTVPLRVDNELIGTVNLFEPKNKIFLNLNRTLGIGITNLLSDQILRARYDEQKNLLVQSELKLVQAQINPHFLFNALNTIIAVTRKDADRARDLLLHLSNFFRKNLKRSGDLATLEEELNHVNSYLKIEKARFEDHLHMEMDIDPSLLSVQIPIFTLQPIIENAIKHGISDMLEQGVIKLSATKENDTVTIQIEDNAGSYDTTNQQGLGMNIVDKRIKNLFGEGFGITATCVPNQQTLIAISVPANGYHAAQSSEVSQ